MEVVAVAAAMGAADAAGAAVSSDGEFVERRPIRKVAVRPAC